MADPTPGAPQDGVNTDALDAATATPEAEAPEAASETAAPEAAPEAAVAEPASPEPAITEGITADVTTPEVLAETSAETSPAAAPAAADPAPPQPELESSTTLPALGSEPAGAGGEEGGEWDLLVSKVRDWLASGQLQALWQQAKTPLTLTLALVGLLLVLRVYSALLAALDSLPLVPGLLELVGVIWLVRNGLPKLVRNSEREQLISGLRQRWQAFLGRS